MKKAPIPSPGPDGRNVHIPGPPGLADLTSQPWFWKAAAAAVLASALLIAWRTPKIRGVMIAVGAVVATFLLIQSGVVGK
jgi:hypothetical protein